MKSTLHIATIANDLGVYGRMRESMKQFGFVEPLCRFSLFDNSTENRYEPYSVLRSLATDGDEPYIVLCHQDLLFDENASYAILLKLLQDLTRRDDRWAVVGNAGGDLYCRVRMYLNDPGGNFRSPAVPCLAQTLDENFLLFARARYPLPSDELTGFHLYGADVALSAIAAGHTAYILPFPVIHLSQGNPHSEAFRIAREALGRLWEQRLLVGLITTTCTYLILSNRRFMRSLLNRYWFATLCQRLGRSIIVRPSYRRAQSRMMATPRESQ